MGPSHWLLIRAGLILYTFGAGSFEADAREVSVSPGCGFAPPTEPPAVTIDGRPRDAIVTIPEDYDPKRPHALVFAFHGRTTPNARARRYYRLEPHAAEATIFVYPSGLHEGDGVYSWSDPGDPSDQLRDYALFDELLAAFANRYCVDLDRVHVVGHSLGGWFANSLACARGDAIRAVATAGGGVSPSECRGRVAAMIIHHPRDRLVDISQGITARDSFLIQNDLSQVSVPAEPRGLNCERHGSPDAEHPVLWCPHDIDRTPGGRYYPHQWPREAGEAVMTFFATLP